MHYTVELNPSARRDFANLHGSIAERVERALHDLEENPRPPGCKKLVGQERLYRIRVGDYRVIYEIHDERVRVFVIRIRHRRDVYR
jgi:mRNA interferase RelE/StbE